ncbi:putative phosphotransferase [Roseibium sp. TrichSKD4]|uniref:pyruvate, water dikinase regulatory protein n=1 Tax=Roseibium sp. TrichSKD4 TaxID=744980 RepID=UPI0001E5702F|nr:pyruvate, water dikinase regulatory protein [Roseibium sp. TrichSKD4]EFO32283.1 putative phosphotransferase [Roseibium sp. TrichSKD4]
MSKSRHYFHLHLVSDSTGETLMTVSRAATAQYENVQAIEHVYPLVRAHKQLDRVISEVEAAPGIVLYTLVDEEISGRLEQKCRELGVPFVNILDPVFAVFQSYLNVTQTHRIGGQHELDAEYFKRMEALNYTMMHDDGQIWDDLESADIVLLGISRTSKTPTCIYLANRGIKAANIPLVPQIPLPSHVKELKKPLIVGLVASAERIQQIRKNRILSLNSEGYNEAYIDRKEIAREITMARRLCSENNWPLIDVTRRSVEETAAEILTLFKVFQARRPLDE